MDYEEWLKSVRRDARYRESAEKSKRLVHQVNRFTNQVIAEVGSQIRRGKDIDLIIRELQSGFNIPQARLKEFSAAIQDELKKYADFRANSGRDLGVSLDDAEFQRLSALTNFEQTAHQQAAQDVINKLESAKRTPSIQSILATGGGVNEIEGLLRTGGLKQHAITEARLAMQQFNSRYTYAVADQSQINIFEYYGPNDGLIRPFCAGLVGFWFTKSQLETMVNGLGYPVLHYCGGPNCRHEPLAVPQQFQNDHPEKMAAQLDYVRLGEDRKLPIGVYTTADKAKQMEAALSS